MKYHRKRYRDTCIGAGHVHCPRCDRALGLTLWQAKEVTHLLCTECRDKNKQSEPLA